MKFQPIIAISLAVLLAACGPNLQNIGKESDPTRFYTLTSSATGVPEGQSAMQNLTLAVGPVNVADYLDRSQIVVRKTDNRLELSDFDRWASTPAKEIQRVMAADLAALLGTERVVTYPWNSEITPNVTVEVNVEQFELTQDGKAHLVAGFQVYGTDGRNALAFRRIHLSEDAGSGYNDISAALSKLSGRLSMEVARMIRSKKLSIKTKN